MRSVSRLLAVLLTAVGASLGVVVATSGPAAACSCVRPDIEGSAHWADAVFVGEITDRAQSEDRYSTIYTFAVDRVYNGYVPPVAEVHSAGVGGGCGLERMEPGRRYVVFAGSGDDGLTSGLCSGTRPARASYVDRVEHRLGAGAAPYDGAEATTGDRDESDPMTDRPLVVVAGVAGVLILLALVLGALRARHSGAVS